MNTYSLISSFLIDYYMYVDVAMVDGKIVTQLFVKTDEPNIFSMMNQIDGDNLDEMIAYGKEHYGKQSRID